VYIAGKFIATASTLDEAKEIVVKYLQQKQKDLDDFLTTGDWI
jgi:hypothetical protein